MQTFDVEPSRSQLQWARSKVSRGEYAKRRRIELLKALSPKGRCAKCRGKFEHCELTVDHVDGCTWNKTRVSAWTRAARYWREYESGVKLRALCGSCNSSDGARRFQGRKRWS